MLYRNISKHIYAKIQKEVILRRGRVVKIKLTL